MAAHAAGRVAAHGTNCLSRPRQAAQSLPKVKAPARRLRSRLRKGRRSPVQSRMTAVQILVIAEHAMIGALLGALVELAGYRPRFVDSGELPEAAIERLRPDLVLLDCEHPAAQGESTYRAAHDAGSRVVLFGSSLTAAETERFAARRGTPCITLPIGYNAFSQRVAAILDRSTGRAPARSGDWQHDEASA